MDFVIIANAWDAGIDNPTSKHQIARELAARGHRVLWVEGSGMRRPALGSRSDRWRILRRLRGAFRGAMPAILPSASVSHPSSVKIWTLVPLLLPLPSSGLARALNGWFCCMAALYWTRRLGFSEATLINYVPVLAECMRGWHGKRGQGPTVYYCVDKWDAFGMYDSATMTEMNRDCCKYADIVIASSRELYEHCAKLRDNTHLITHGVDYEHFARALGFRIQGSEFRGERRQANGNLSRPDDLPAGRIIGFFGLLSEWVDQDLIVKIARTLPECNMVLLGKADVPIVRLRNEPNIHILGPKPFSELPIYIAHFTVGIIPFVVNDLTRAVNPIKLREMMAAGCPIVSTALPEVEAMSERVGVAIAGTYEEFTRLVRERIEVPLSEAEARRLSEKVKNETWAAKADKMVELIASWKSMSRP